MFCPKCGTKNPDNGKFCRNCGTDLSPVSDVLSGKSGNKLQGFGKFQPNNSVQLFDKKGKPVHWESAMTKLFSGIAFLAVTIALAFSAMGTGWWFWMLIPAFSMLGAGIAQIIQLRKNEKLISVTPPEVQNVLKESSKAELPPSNTDYVAPDSRYRTGDLAAPPSVTENTTRHLEMDSEGETMTLPKSRNNQN